MNRIVKSIFLFLAFASTIATADSIQLRNGRHLQGKYIGGTATLVGFMSAGAVEYFSTADVLALMFDNSESSLNDLQPNQMNGDSWQAPQTRNMSLRPRKDTWHSQRQAKPVSFIATTLMD
jgi:hypothetical protein